MAKFAVILPAAGKSSRFKDKEKKPYVTLDGRAIWLRAAELFIARDDVCQTILVIDKDDEEMVRRRYQANLAFMNVQLCHGGAERFESVANALAKLNEEAEFVAIHDAVRPCVTEELVSAVFGEATRKGAAMLAAKCTDTLKEADKDQKVTATLSRKNVWLAQTPQVFRRDWLKEAYEQRSKLGKEITDDAQLVEAAGHPVHLVESPPSNIKITTKGDVALADAILKSRPKPKPNRPAHPFAEEEMWGGR
ncbi:MAG: 2-C-methyl-D-erythritol 4-phosphate cytidylyltransferase [Gemmataceae bacterium]